MEDEEKSLNGGTAIFVILMAMISVGILACGLFFMLKPAPDELGAGRGRYRQAASRGRGRYEAPDKVVEEKPAASENEVASRPMPELRNRLVRDKLVTPVGDGKDVVTIMIYLNGSNLESWNGFATSDISEMLEADGSDKVNILIETVGTMQWQDYDIASDHSQRYLLKNKEFTLVDDSLPQVDLTKPEGLSDFISWGAENYPADRYFLILWDHGGGSVDGFGYDEWQDTEDSLTIDELRQALKQSGLVFDFIGMDACIMASIETCYALYDYCDYCILSEDFESALGWSYTGWLTALAGNTSMDTEDLAKIIVDDMVLANEDDCYYGGSSTLALIDERYVPQAFEAWETFAFANEEALLTVNYSREVERSGRAAKVSYELAQYFITDMLALAVSVPSPQTKILVSRLASCVAYYNCSFDNTGLTGLAVTLPYNNNEFYHSLGRVFAGAGINKRYITWLGNFQTDAATDEYYDYGDFDEEWEGWDELGDEYYD